jgi:hypothetical protein
MRIRGTNYRMIADGYNYRARADYHNYKARADDHIVTRSGPERP